MINVDDNVNVECYLQFLRNILPNFLQNVTEGIGQVLIYQRESAPPHYHRIVQNFLNEIIATDGLVILSGLHKHLI